MPNKADWVAAIDSLPHNRTYDRFELESPQFIVAGWCICPEHQRGFRSVVLRWEDQNRPPACPVPPAPATVCLPSDRAKGWAYRVPLAPEQLAGYVAELRDGGRLAEEAVTGSGFGDPSENRDRSLTTPQASDITDPPERVKTTTYRVLRDTALARRVKRMHSFECQICGDTITLPNGSRYAEAHHVKPLGDPHGGPDTIGNIVCLCPNHHAECDLGVIKLSLSSFRRVGGHDVDRQFIEYHNHEIYGGTK